MKSSAKQGDLNLFALSHPSTVDKTLGHLRTFVALDLELIDNSAHLVLWVKNFPMSKCNYSEQTFKALHHPCTASNPHDMSDLFTSWALAYGMMCNGIEIGGGRLGIYKWETQKENAVNGWNHI